MAKRVECRARGGLFAIILALTCTTAHALPSFETVRGSWRSSDWVLLDRHGEAIQRLRLDMSARRGDWVALADISPALRQALLVSEDKRFYEHSGVDWRGVAAAAWGNLWQTRTRGASTVTMQLAGLLDADAQQRGRRSLPQKIDQVVDAFSLEHSWRKDQILEAYLNRVPFRGELVGISALSATLFGKAPSGLDNREAALTAALIRAPNASYSRVAERACKILADMDAPQPCANLIAYAQPVLTRSSAAAQEYADNDDASDLAPHFARYLAASAHPVAGARIRSTLDAPLQRFARAALYRILRELNGTGNLRNVHDGALVVLDNASGDVLAWVGSSGTLSDATEVDTVTSLRQAGSTLKPFLYAQAFDERRLSAASLLDDAPLDLPTGGGLYMPQDYDSDFKGWISVRTALGSSLNVPAVRTLVMVTPHRLRTTLFALGLPLNQSGDYYGYSLALGSADVTLLSLSNAYRALADGGLAGTVRTRLEVPVEPPKQRIFSTGTSFIVANILADNNARTRTFGFDNPLATRAWSAVKTGTSKDMRDNWAVGFSRRYTVGVWVGNDDGAPMRDVSGVTGAAPIWASVMNYLLARSSSVAPPPPADVVRTRLQYADNIEAPRDEWFLRGTETTLIQLAGDTRRPGLRSGVQHIAAPADGTIFALDPDIPPARQRIWFGAANTAGATPPRWRLDGKRIGDGMRHPWLPWPGRHTLELLDANDQVIDAVHFEVRGAAVMAGTRITQTR